MASKDTVVNYADKTIYPNVYTDSDGISIKVKLECPTLETTVTETIGMVTQSALEDGLLFETEFLDLTRYSNITDIVMK